jgi:ABC-type transport system substrate-binding protein
MRKTGSPWTDVRLRRAANLAINRADVIRYAANGNGMVIPALVPVQGFGHDPSIAPYPFDPGKARELLREAANPDGLAISLIAPEYLDTLATVVSKMLEQVGFKVERQVLDTIAYNRKTFLGGLDQPAEQQRWDIALTDWVDVANFSLFELYHTIMLDGAQDWTTEQPELRSLYERALRTVELDRQQALVRQMEQHTAEQAYLLFLYNPIQLYAVNKAVRFVPHVTGFLSFVDTSVTDQHWSMRKTAANR